MAAYDPYPAASSYPSSSNRSANVSSYWEGNTPVYEKVDYNGESISPLLCNICVDNYIISSDNKKCYPKQNYPNCIKVDISNDKCIECESQFALRNNICESRNI